MIRDRSVNEKSGAGAPQEKDDAWLQDSRIQGDSTLDKMSPQERAKVAAPMTQAPEPTHDGPPDWETVMRGNIRMIPGDFTEDDVIAYCRRFQDITSNPPPAYGKGNDKWRVGATNTLEQFHAALLTHYEKKGTVPSLALQRRMFNLCVDIFFQAGTGYDHITAPSPGSLANSMPSLIGNIKEIHDMYNLAGGLPDGDQIEQWAQQKKQTGGRKSNGGPTQADETVRQPTEADLAAARTVVERERAGTT